MIYLFVLTPDRIICILCSSYSPTNSYQFRERSTNGIINIRESVNRREDWRFRRKKKEGLSVLIKHSSSNSSIRLVRQSQSLLSPLSPSQSFAWLSLNSEIPPFPHHPIVATLYINLLLILSTLLSRSIT